VCGLTAFSSCLFNNFVLENNNGKPFVLSGFELTLFPGRAATTKHWEWKITEANRITGLPFLGIARITCATKLNTSSPFFPPLLFLNQRITFHGSIILSFGHHCITRRCHHLEAVMDCFDEWIMSHIIDSSQ